MSEIQNTFHQGMVLDYPDYQVPNSVYTYAENITFVTHNGEEMILQNEKGNTFTTSLKNNYVPIASKSYGGVCYIISAEVVNNKFTGRGEIGSFPSPDYNNLKVTSSTSEGDNYETVLIDEYRPFYNYAGDNNVITGSALVESGYGEFNSINFNFQIDKPVEIVAVQPSYDGTVNVIFTDDFNKPKLINSRFTVRRNKKVEIINRLGSSDSNLYTEDNFNNRLNHILTSNKLVTVTFDGQQTGGNLPTGLYKYSFKYSTADGNLTNFIAETFSIPVFFGDSVATTKGGITNENTDKLNVITLHNLDTSYSSIKVYFSYSSGTVGADAQEEAFEIEDEISITGTEVQFRHIGVENVTSIPLEELTLTSANINTYKTGCEIKGRLAIANIQERSYDVNILRDFSKSIKIYTAVKQLAVNGLDEDNSHSAIYSSIKYDSTARDTFEGAYYNPRNVHDYLGYWGGETYMFGIEYIFDDGSSTAIIPIRGIDNYDNNASYSSQEFIDIDFDDNTGENIRGIYRFPSRDKIPLIEQDATSSYVNILFPEFDVPDLPSTITDLGIVGYKFYRSRRKIDCIGQGKLFDTIIFPTQDKVLGSSQDLNYFGQYYDKDGYRPNNSRYFPAYNFIFDAAGRQARNDNDDRPSPTRTSVENTGIEVLRQHHLWYESDDNLDFYYRKKFAFISPDFICNPIANQRLYSSSSFTLKDLGNIVSVYSIKSNTPFILEGGRGSSAPWKDNETLQTDRSFSLIKQSSLESSDYSELTVDLDYVTGGVVATTTNNFSSQCDLNPLATNFQNFDEIFSGNQGQLAGRRDYNRFAAIYNDYVGVTTEDVLDLGSTNATPRLPAGASIDNISPNPETVTVKIGDQEYDVTEEVRTDAIHLNGFNFTNGVTQIEKTAKLVNIYRGSGPRDLLTIKQIYNPEFESFYPITQPIYASNSIASSLNATGVNGIIQSKDNLQNSNSRLEGVNGDCFTNMVHRRLYTSSISRTDAEQPAVAATNLGYSVAFVAESNFNVAGRVENIADLNEGTRSFYPYLARNHQEADLTSSVKGEDDNWRVQRLPETKQYNTGYDKLENGRLRAAITVSNPFIQNDFSTRIWTSDVYTSNSFDNAYRFFPLNTYEDYPRYLGEIVSIKNYGGNIFCVHEYGCTLIPVSERIAQTGDSAGQVFFEAPSILNPPQNIQYISELHGSQWQFSVLATDNGIYGVDMNTAKIWRYVGNGLQLLSDMNVQSFLRQIQPTFKEQSYKWFFKQIRTYYDKKLADVIFTFVSSGEDCPTETIETPATCPTVSGDENGIIISGGTPASTEEIPTLCYDNAILKTLVYNEYPVGKFKTFTSWYPVNMFNIYDRLFSFPLLSNRNSLYEHYTNELRSVYYDEEHGFVVEFVATASTMIHQIFNNLKIIGRHIYPYKIEYTTDESTYVSTIRPETPEQVTGQYIQPIDDTFSQIDAYNASIKEDHVYIQIVKDASDIYNRVATEPDNKKIRDKFCKIRIFYDTTKSNLIQAITTSVSK